MPSHNFKLQILHLRIKETSDQLPLSKLPLLSKVFETVIFDQLSEYSEKYLGSLLCSFQKTCSTQNVLFNFCAQGKNQYGFVGTILMDLSKTFGWLAHDVFAAKFETMTFIRQI